MKSTAASESARANSRTLCTTVCTSSDQTHADKKFLMQPNGKCLIGSELSERRTCLIKTSRASASTGSLYPPKVFPYCQTTTVQVELDLTGLTNYVMTCSKNSDNLRLRVIEVNKQDSQQVLLLGTDLNAKKTSQQIHPNVRVLIQGVWASNRIAKHSTVHILNATYNQETDTHSIDNSNGFLVLEPDNLLTCTLVASTLFCERKTWLNHVFLGQIGTNRAMLVGTLVHEVFQYGVKHKISDIDKLCVKLDDLLDDATVMLEIYSVEMNLVDIRAEAKSYIPSVKEWIEKYMFSGPRYPLTNDADMEVKITRVHDIEENIWSTKYGFKGKIDVTGLVKVHNKRDNTIKDKIIPLELKTGNPNLSSSHSAQVSLYSMMIEDRYAETNQGFVIYLKEKAAMHNVVLTHNIKRDLIQRRNQINYHMKSYMFGPDMLDQPRMCTNCERLTECVLTSQLYSPGQIDTYSTMKSLEASATGHLDEKFIAFFQRYHEKLINLMTQAKTASVETVPGGDQPIKTSMFWTYSSDIAESMGTGVAKLQASYDPENPSLVTFKRDPKYVKSSSQPSGNKDTMNDNTQSDTNSSSCPAAKKRRIQDYFKPAIKVSKHIDNDDDVIMLNTPEPFNTQLDFNRCRMAISYDDDNQNMDSQNSSTAIAIGFINELKHDRIVVKLFECAPDGLKTKGVLYRMDKLEKKSSQLDIERVVLVRLLGREDWRCDRIRQLITDPSFKRKENDAMNLHILSQEFDEISKLNPTQQEFVVEAAATDNFCMLDDRVVEGNKNRVHHTIMGLTSVINAIERSVLIVAQNVDSLVDLMSLLQNRRIKFILLDDGRSSKARFQYAINLVKVPQGDASNLDKRFNAYIRQMEQARVVITSYAMSVGGLVFTRRTFDYCVCYDCNTTELLLALSPMFSSDRYILVDVRGSSQQQHQLEQTANQFAATADSKATPSNGAGHKPSKPSEDKMSNISLGDHLRRLRNSTPTTG